jgi:hypothetical protein
MNTEMSAAAKAALMKIRGLRKLSLEPEAIKKAEKKVLSTIGLTDLADVAAALIEGDPNGAR